MNEWFSHCRVVFLRRDDGETKQQGYPVEDLEVMDCGNSSDTEWIFKRGLPWILFEIWSALRLKQWGNKWKDFKSMKVTGELLNKITFKLLFKVRDIL